MPNSYHKSIQTARLFVELQAVKSQIDNEILPLIAYTGEKAKQIYDLEEIAENFSKAIDKFLENNRVEIKQYGGE